MGLFLLVRHSAVEIEPDKPADEWRLSDDGRARCRWMASRLARYRPALFVTSQEAKAKETGQILADESGVPWQTAAGLHEHERRHTPYLAQAAFAATMADFFARPNELLFGQETAEQARRRFSRAVSDVLAQHPAGPVAIVAHGTVITLFLSHHNAHLAPFALWRGLTLPCFFVVALPDMALLNAVYYPL
jgi:broad specificity phosphatase PhoE